MQPEEARARIAALGFSDADTETLFRHYDDAERRAKAHGMKGDALFISPYSHADVIAGAGTVGLEILEDWPDVDSIVVPIGGGGLVSGIAIAAAASGRASVAGVGMPASSMARRTIAACAGPPRSPPKTRVFTFTGRALA